MGHGHRAYCLCVTVCTSYSPMYWCPHFSLVSVARAEARDGELCGLTMVAFMKQVDTGWEEDVGELRDLPDHVHCSQNSLQGSGGSDRAGVCQNMTPPTSTTW